MQTLKPSRRRTHLHLDYALQQLPLTLWWAALCVCTCWHRRQVRSAGRFPLFVRDAGGAHFTSVDGDEYIDFCLGDTGAMAGHAPPPSVRVRACAGGAIAERPPSLASTCKLPTCVPPHHLGRLCQPSPGSGKERGPRSQCQKGAGGTQHTPHHSRGGPQLRLVRRREGPAHVTSARARCVTWLRGWTCAL